MKLKHLTAPIVQCKDQGGDETTGTIGAIVSVFGVRDSYDEVVDEGAFKKSLGLKLPKFVWAHRWDQPIGKTLSGRELSPGDPLLPASVKSKGGLFMEGAFNLGTQRGKDAHSDLLFGCYDEFSFSFWADDEYKGKDGLTHLREVTILEWSPVMAGANPETLPVYIKSRMERARSVPAAKSVYLGNYIEASMALCSLYRLVDGLCYDALWNVLYDDDEPTEERMMIVDAALAEFSSIASTVCRNFMDLQASEEPNEIEVGEDPAPMPDDDMMEMGIMGGKAIPTSRQLEYFRSQWADGKTAAGGRPMDTRVRALLADAKDVAKSLKEVQALRLKDSRSLSVSRVAQVNQAIELLRSIESAARPKHNFNQAAARLRYREASMKYLASGDKA